MNHREAPSVLITGCSSGIGRCLADGLRERGYRVFATARRGKDVAGLAQDGFEALQLDLDDDASIAAALGAVIERTGGRVSALVNNGAYGQPGAVEDLSRDTLRAQFETNLFGTHELTRQVVPVMRRAGGGRIIQISSILGLLCLPYRGAYNASKYALEALTDTLRMELVGTGIHVALIEPGAIHSRFRANSRSAFERHIDPSGSPHQAQYAEVLRRLGSTQPVRFSLPPGAVLERVVHALESPRPRLRYRVTRPAQAMAILKRMLPDRVQDRLITRFAGG